MREEEQPAEKTNGELRQLAARMTDALEKRDFGELAAANRKIGGAILTTRRGIVKKEHLAYDEIRRICLRGGMYYQMYREHVEDARKRLGRMR